MVSNENGAKYKTALILVTCLFFMWGLSYGLVDVLNKHFQAVLGVNKAQSGLIQAAYFGAYFVAAVPAGLFMNKMGYKAGIILGLTLYAVGALLFVPAAWAMSFGMFLGALFVLALGLGCLETASNPYSAALGDPDKAETRLNFSQSFNGLGQFIGPIIGGTLFFQADAGAGQNAAGGLDSVKLVYVGIACVVLALLALIARTKMPDLRDNEHAADAAQGDVGHRSMWEHKEFIFGVAAQFLYVAAQVGLGAFFINLTLECLPELTPQNAAYLLSVAMFCLLAGRFISTGIMTRIAPARLLALYGVICAALSLVVCLGMGRLSVIALIAAFFFISIMFPTIFAMGVKNLGSRTRLGSSCMIMAIVGGAIMPYFMGHIADVGRTSVAYLLPAGCFVAVALYGAAYPRLSTAGHTARADTDMGAATAKP